MLSYDSFESSLQLLKARFVFYHYFIRAAMGEESFKRAIREDNKRITNNQTEAMALVLIKNYHQSWVFERWIESVGRGNTFFTTEYEEAPNTKKVSVLDYVLPDVEFDDKASTPEDMIVRRWDNEERYKKLREQRLSLQEKLHQKAKQNCLYDLDMAKGLANSLLKFRTRESELGKQNSDKGSESEGSPNKEKEKRKISLKKDEEVAKLRVYSRYGSDRDNIKSNIEVRSQNKRKGNHYSAVVGTILFTC